MICPSTCRTTAPKRRANLRRCVRYYLSEAAARRAARARRRARGRVQARLPDRVRARARDQDARGARLEAQLRAVGEFIESHARGRARQGLCRSSASSASTGAVPKDEPVPGPAKDELEVRAETDRPDNRVVAGEPHELDGDRHQQGDVARLPAAGHHRERQPLLRREGAGVRQDRARQVEDRANAARLVRGRGPPGRDDQAQGRQRQADLQDPDGCADPKRRPQGALRRRGRPRAEARSRSARRLWLCRGRCSSTATRSPTTSTATATACSRRASSATMYLTVRNVGPAPLVRDPGQPRQSLRRRACSCARDDSTSPTCSPATYAQVAFTFDVEAQLRRPRGRARALGRRPRPARVRHREDRFPIVAPVDVDAGHRRGDRGPRDPALPGRESHRRCASARGERHGAATARARRAA